MVEQLDSILDLPNLDDDNPNPNLEDDLEIEPLSPSDLLSPVSPTTINFLLDPPDSKIPSPPPRALTITLSTTTSERPPFPLSFTEEAAPIPSTQHPPRFGWKDIRKILPSKHHHQWNNEIADQATLNKQHKRKYYTKRAIYVERPRFNADLKYTLLPQLSTWNIVSWDSKRQEYTIENPALKGQRLTVPLRSISARFNHRLKPNATPFIPQNNLSSNSTTPDWPPISEPDDPEEQKTLE